MLLFARKTRKPQENSVQEHEVKHVRILIFLCSEKILLIQTLATSDGKKIN
jgi:hypothetical protein